MQLKIDLLDVSLSVWHRLIVPDNIKLPTLHQVLQVALGWTDRHLHQFVIAGISYSNADPDEAGELDHRDERRTPLNNGSFHVGVLCCSGSLGIEPETVAYPAIIDVVFNNDSE